MTDHNQNGEEPTVFEQAVGLFGEARNLAVGAFMQAAMTAELTGMRQRALGLVDQAKEVAEDVKVAVEEEAADLQAAAAEDQETILGIVEDVKQLAQERAERTQNAAANVGEIVEEGLGRLGIKIQRPGL